MTPGSKKTGGKPTFYSLVILMLIHTLPLHAQNTDELTAPEPETAALEQAALDVVSDPFGIDVQEEETPAEESGVDECDWYLEDQELQEQSREILRSWSCHSFRWFDSWWGDEYDYPEQAVNGLLTVGADYSQYHGFDPRLRLKVRAPLPNLDNRWDVIFGRVDEEAYITDTQGQDRTFYNPGIIDRGEEDSWLLGLGHRRKGRKSGWDYSVGVRLKLPPEPYAKLSYFYNKQFNENTDLRFRQTFFWRSNQGFGTTSRGDLAYAVNVKNVLRWEAIATISEITEGTDWYVGQTWYHLFGDRSAFSLLSFIGGSTGAPVETKEFGFNLIWRKPFTRDWIYLSMGPSITWPRHLAEEEREMSLGFGMWIELEFGNWRY